jgi:hypothetical protein
MGEVMEPLARRAHLVRGLYGGQTIMWSMPRRGVTEDTVTGVSAAQAVQASRVESATARSDAPPA